MSGAGIIALNGASSVSQTWTVTNTGGLLFNATDSMGMGLINFASGSGTHYATTTNAKTAGSILITGANVLSVLVDNALGSVVINLNAGTLRAQSPNALQDNTVNVSGTPVARNPADDRHHLRHADAQCRRHAHHQRRSVPHPRRLARLTQRHGADLGPGPGHHD